MTAVSMGVLEWELAEVLADCIFISVKFQISVSKPRYNWILDSFTSWNHLETSRAI